MSITGGRSTSAENGTPMLRREIRQRRKRDSDAEGASPGR